MFGRKERKKNTGKWEGLNEDLEALGKGDTRDRYRGERFQDADELSAENIEAYQEGVSAIESGAEMFPGREKGFTGCQFLGDKKEKKKGKSGKRRWSR